MTIVAAVKEPFTSALEDASTVIEESIVVEEMLVLEDVRETEPDLSLKGLIAIVKFYFLYSIVVRPNIRTVKGFS